MSIILLILLQVGPAAPETLDDLVRVALRQNPEIHAAARSWEAAQARPSQVRALPNPTVSFSYRNSASPLPGTSIGDNPMSFVEPMLTQRLPFPGKRGLRGDIAQTEADAEGRYYDAVELRVVADLKRAWLDLYRVERSMETVERSRELLDRFASVAQSRYEVGEGLQQDVLRAQVEQTLLEDRLSELGRQAGELRARINELLDRPSEDPVITVADLTLSPLDYTAEELFAIGEEANPVLGSYRLGVESGAKSVELARKAHLPDFDLKFGRVFMGPFDDLWDVSVSTQIPLFFGRKERRGVEESTARLRESESQLDAASRRLEREVTDFYLAVGTAERLESLYREAVIPQASLTLESSLTAYRVGSVDFLGVLDHWSTLLEFEIDYYTQVAEHEKALAGLEELTGLRLVVGDGGAE
jgi:outer membrane protein, heavy metal efflux system